MNLLYTIAIQETAKIKISSKIYEIEKGKLRWVYFFINQASYLKVSRPFVPLSDVEKSGTFPAFQETKAVTNSELDVE